MKMIAPSLLSADFAKLGHEIQEVQLAGADLIHVDVMDGHFVPNITIGPPVVQCIKRAADLPLDVHLMIENPDAYVADFAKAGSDWITVHSEASVHLNRTLQLIRECGAHPAVCLNPSTPLSHLDYVLEYVDMVLLMSVNPGFGGQRFIPNVLQKIERLKRTITERGLNVLIEVDGGVNLDTIGSVARAGADIFVAGSAIFNSENYAETISRMKAVIESEGPN
jgi:ribulose-phosphate 3-epimerase